VLLLALGGCAETWGVSYDRPVSPALSRGWRLAGVAVSVPESLTVSEANVLMPNADIVWHGDPPGDRRAQVAAIVREGLTRGAAPLRGSRPVRIAVEVRAFHAVTPRAVAIAPQAVHHIALTVQVLSANDGAALMPPQTIEADLEARVGKAAARPPDERVRIVDHLARVFRGWLGLGPDPRRTFRSFGR